MYRYYVVFLTCLLFNPQAFSATPAEDVAASYGTAVAKEEWARAATFFSSESLKEIRRGFDPLLNSRSLQLSFFPGKSKEEIEQLGDVEFVSSIFGYFFRTMRSRGIEIEMNPPRILGSVEEGPESTHVVYRQEGRVNGSEVSVVDMMTVQKIDEGWYVGVPEEFEGFVASIQDRLARASK